MADANAERAPRKKGLPEAVKTVVEIFAPAAVAFVLFTFVLGIGDVHGSSMEPLYDDNTMTIFFRWAQADRQDIVLVRSEALGEMIIKRVIALPGDRVSIQNSVVCLNGEALDEPYVAYPGGPDMAELTVPEGTVFVLGDNRAVSLDSRALGPLPEDEVLGTVLFSFQLPFS